MRIPPLVPLLFLLWPLGEIAAFIWIGGRIGVVNTIALIVLAAFGGLALFRVQGLGLLRQVQAELNAGRMPADKLLEGFAVLLAGFLLILPGFLSDIIALLLLFGPLRRALLRLAMAGMVLRTTGASATWTSRPREPGVVDLDADEYREQHSPGAASGPTALPGRGPDNGGPGT